ncbi:hypothetical protein TPHA_0L01330 [Tetrapisispora phaffii CBS 4417]|uniref:Uncharacterized protein n=1 Tax=Tetrapisispora phaffii (strain ATCC 24235 / CBS 4417 / NBRC 1672 / NRRL Y-8282 / UCD 70-5) TaxID=1071381 RepID=G8C010_TETPH|nr:hypothetical protein TPHA_0L01330 [Tetrapisispora phaffii CBS 4417]CCE65488.1 hypothetical protein TPHA_0L01330 [Tetrapisispora phaffii CBS 4417]
MLTDIQNKALKTSLITFILNEQDQNSIARKKRALHKILVGSFINGVCIEYKNLFKKLNIVYNCAELVKFAGTLIQRVKLSRTQFKKSCFILVKILNACVSHSINYLQYLRNDIRKVIIGSFLLSFSTTNKQKCPTNHSTKESKLCATNDIFEQIATREKRYSLFALATGLSSGEIGNIANIARTIVARQVRLQNRTLQHQRNIRRYMSNFGTGNYPYIRMATDEAAQNEQNVIHNGVAIDIDNNETQHSSQHSILSDPTGSAVQFTNTIVNQNVNTSTTTNNFPNMNPSIQLNTNDEFNDMSTTSSSNGIHKVIENIISVFGEDSINQYGLLNDDKSYSDIVNENNELGYVFQAELDGYKEMGIVMVKSYFNII